MEYRLFTRLSAVAFFCASITQTTVAQDCGPEPSRYLVRFEGGTDVEIDLRLGQPASALDLFHFPLDARPDGQSASLMIRSAETADGTPVDLAYVSDGTWVPAEPVQRVRYTVKTDHDAVDWSVGGPGKDEVATRFGNTLFFAGHAYFLADYAAAECPLSVEYSLPEDWATVSPMMGDGLTYKANRLWPLVQNVHLITSDPVERRVLGGLEITWQFDPRTGPIRADLEALLEEIPAAYADYMGYWPGRRYLSVILSDHTSDGGAFLNSFALRIATTPNLADAVTWQQTLGHEVMHLWNANGALAATTIDQVYWYTEGFTDYLTYKLMHRYGLIDDQTLEEHVATTVRRFMTAQTNSPDVPLIAAGTSKLDNWHLLYGGGALMAMVLDGEMSQANPGSFRAMITEITQDWGGAFELDALLAIMEKHSDGRAQEVLAWIDTHPDFAEVRARLAPLGVDVARFLPEEIYVRINSGQPEAVFGRVED